jgi:hypothetical protein
MNDSEQKAIDALKTLPAYDGWGDDEIRKNVNDLLSSGDNEKQTKAYSYLGSSLPAYRGWSKNEIHDNLKKIFQPPTPDSGQFQDILKRGPQASPAPESNPEPDSLDRALQESAKNKDSLVSAVRSAFPSTAILSTDRGTDYSKNPFWKEKQKPATDFSHAEKLFPDKTEPSAPSDKKQDLSKNVIKKLPEAKQKPKNEDPFTMVDTDADKTLAAQVRDMPDTQGQGDKAASRIAALPFGAEYGVWTGLKALSNLPVEANNVIDLVHKNMYSALDKVFGDDEGKNLYEMTKNPVDMSKNPVANALSSVAELFNPNKLSGDAFTRGAFQLGAMVPIVVTAAYHPEAAPQLLSAISFSEGEEAAQERNKEHPTNVAHEDLQLLGAAANGAIDGFCFKLAQLPLVSGLRTAFAKKVSQVGEEEAKKWIGLTIGNMVKKSLAGGVKNTVGYGWSVSIANDLIKKVTDIDPDITYKQMADNALAQTAPNMILGSVMAAGEHIGENYIPHVESILSSIDDRVAGTATVEPTLDERGEEILLRGVPEKQDNAPPPEQIRQERDEFEKYLESIKDPEERRTARVEGLKKIYEESKSVYKHAGADQPDIPEKMIAPELQYTHPNAELYYNILKEFPKFAEEPKPGDTYDNHRQMFNEASLDHLKDNGSKWLNDAIQAKALEHREETIKAEVDPEIRQELRNKPLTDQEVGLAREEIEEKFKAILRDDPTLLNRNLTSALSDPGSTNAVLRHLLAYDRAMEGAKKDFSPGGDWKAEREAEHANIQNLALAFKQSRDVKGGPKNFMEYVGKRINKHAETYEEFVKRRACQ